jgi:hypothetical protein
MTGGASTVAAAPMIRLQGKAGDASIRPDAQGAGMVGDR